MPRVFLLFLMVIVVFSAPVHARGEDGDHGTEGDRDTSVFQVGEIVVRDRAIASIEDASTTTVITGKEIKKRSDKTLDESLQMVPGINVYQNQKGNMVFDMRGFEHAKVAILVDGIPFEEVFYSGGGDISRIPVMNASRIVINRGVSSALYGPPVMAVTMPSPNFSRSLRASSRAYSSYGLATYFNPSSSIPVPSPFILMVDSVSGTSFVHTMEFTFSPLPSIHRVR